MDIMAIAQDENWGVIAMSKKYRAKIKDKNQVTINKELLEQLNLSQGQEIELFVKDGVLQGRPILSWEITEADITEWSDERKQAEQEVDEWVEAGGLEDTKSYSTDDVILELRKRMKKE